MSDVAEMKIGALAPWFGAKRTMAATIVAELGPHSAYWEPFCGSMAILLAKPESSHEHVNDLHGELINLARVIACPLKSSQLHARLERVLFDEKRRAESLVALPTSEDPLDRAFHYFIISWFGRNGFSGTDGCLRDSSFAVRWTPDGGHGGQRFASAVDSIPAWHRRLRRTTILQRDAFKVIESIQDDVGVVLYVDPPYLVKGARYQHDFTDDDHMRLARLLRRFKRARVVVSYYRHSVLPTLYPPQKWTHVDCAINKGLHNTGRRGTTGKEAPEVLLVNGPSLVTKQTTLF